MRLAVLGGSFDPIHIGHLYLADLVLSDLGYDRVILIPACVSPFKRDAGAAPAKDRLDMILASITANPRIGVDDAELSRGGVSFAVDTVSAIIERYRPEGKPGFVIGGDLVPDFHKWKSADTLAAKTDLIVARRTPVVPRGDFRYPHTDLENDVMAVSSTLIRNRIAGDAGRGTAWRSLVPPGARLVIEARGLYGLNGSPPPPPGAAGGTGAPVGTGADGGAGLFQAAAAVEEAARAALTEPRFLHSRNTALVAFDLARRYGLDAPAAYLAGIGHDLGKALDREHVRAVAERDGAPVTAVMEKNPLLLHGRAAAVLLRERFGIHNRDVLEAVALHTTGGRGMCPLAMAVFIADKIEYSREAAGGLRELSEQAGVSLERLFYAVLDDTVRHLRSKNREIAEETLALECGARRECEKGR
ncbi:MAG: nicotinate (nicotinamide) nucleotide adenylyltransferase [Treponema sp.]|jgi:nicotinate-nucleotide adenylyltransferase|nr:nicotinate (nicotinamide) nucleotide adenylyltransferase [Treponema sp.]